MLRSRIAIRALVLNSFCLDLIVCVPLYNAVDLVFVLATVNTIEGFDVGAGNINTCITVLDALYQKPYFGLHKACEHVVRLLCSACGNDAKVVFMILCEKGVPLKEICPRFPSCMDLVDNCVCALEFIHHDFHC
jgi:hypothetical protein